MFISASIILPMKAFTVQFWICEAIPVRSLVLIWINWLMGLVDWGSHFRMKIILGTLPNWCLVFYVYAPGCSRNRSGVCLYLWFWEVVVEFRPSIQNEGPCPAEFLGKLFKDPVFNLPGDLCYNFLAYFRNGRVSRLAVPSMFLLQRLPTIACFSMLTSFEGEKLNISENLLNFVYLTNPRIQQKLTLFNIN